MTVATVGLFLSLIIKGETFMLNCIFEDAPQVSTQEPVSLPQLSTQEVVSLP